MNRRDFTKFIVAGAGLMATPQLVSAKSSSLHTGENAVNNRTLLNSVKDKLSAGEDVRIDCYGDSVMWGSTPFDIAKQSPQSAPKILNDVLRSIFQNNKIVVNNFGIQGSTLLGFVTGDDHSQGSIELKAKNKVDVIYINHGINDALQNTPLVKYSAALHRTIDACLQNGVALIFVTPNVMGINGFGSLKISSKLKLYSEEMKSVAAERGIETVDQFSFTTRDTSKHNPKVVIPDGAHLSDFNYNQLGHNLAFPIVNYAYLRSGDVYRFIGIDVGIPNNINVINDDSTLTLSGSGLKSISLPLLLDDGGVISVDVSGKKVYANINGVYRGMNSSDDHILVNINAESDRAGLKLLTVSSNDDFTLKSVKVKAL